MNPIYKLMQALPTNGWTTVIGAVGLVLFGLGGIITGKLDQQSAMEAILLGITGLGLGNKLDKSK